MKISTAFKFFLLAAVLALAGGVYAVTLTGMASGPFGAHSVYGNLAPVSESGNYAMFLAGLGIIGAMIRRRSS